MQGNLTDKDIEILIDAVECWKNDPGSQSFGMALMGMMLPSDDKEEEEKQKRAEEVLDEGNRETNLRKETATLVTAKLIHMKNEMLFEGVKP